VNLNQRNVLPKARPGCRAPKFNDNKLSIFSELVFGDCFQPSLRLECLWSRKHVLVAASSPRVDAHNRSAGGCTVHRWWRLEAEVCSFHQEANRRVEPHRSACLGSLSSFRRHQSPVREKPSLLANVTSPTTVKRVVLKPGNRDRQVSFLDANPLKRSMNSVEHESMASSDWRRLERL
jgi:hypothetical protein